MSEIRVAEYLDSGRSPFRRWFDELDATAAAKVTTALYRLGQGNFSNVKGVGRDTARRQHQKTPVSRDQRRGRCLDRL